VDTSSLNRLESDFLRARTEKWAAIVTSVGAAVTYLLLLLLLYLFVDLLVWRGRVASYAELTPAKQREFADEWRSRDEGDRKDALGRAAPGADLTVLLGGDKAPPPTAVQWEQRWRAGMYLALRDRVSQEAADAYLPAEPPATSEPRELGVLSLVARERNRWTGSVLGSLASWNGWTWRPGASGSANLTYITGLLVLAFTIGLARGLFVNAMIYLAAVVRLDLLTRLRRAIYLHTYRLGSLTVRTGGSGEPAQLFTKHAEAVGDAVHGSLTTTFRSPIMVLGLLVLILLVNFWLAVSCLLLASLVWLVTGQIAAHFRREARLGSRQGESSLALLAESLGLLRLVKCYQMERFNQARVERQLAAAGRGAWHRLRGEALSRPLLGAVALLAGIALLYLAGRSVLAGEFTVAGLVLTATALLSLVVPVADWIDARLRARRGRESADAIMEFLDRRGEAAEAADAEYLHPLTTRIEFRNVTVQEPGRERPILENVTFAVPAGSRIALVGPDATEKRTLAYLLPRFLDPTSGEIRVEDKNIRWVTHQSLRGQVALVMQDDQVFADTVANNIGCGDPEFNLPQIIEAAKLAHAHQFIERLPHGYETLVGAQGYSLQPGERFRLALARALLRDPSILIIEEPTGPTDEDTLALLDDTLARAGSGRTIIFLANRLSTLRGVERVFLLRDGHLEASGTHRDLWQNNEYYRRLQVVADATTEAATVRD
jgi:ABC-type multidrug transport system fused ATPase/permease subunit